MCTSRTPLWAPILYHEDYRSPQTLKYPVTEETGRRWARPYGMASTYQLKTRFQSLLRPLTGWLYARGITANQVTVGACLISVAIGVGTVLGGGSPFWFLLIALWCLPRMMANAIDGMLAREFKQASRLGAVLNELGDVISDAALYLAFVLVQGTQLWWIIAIVVLAIISEFTGLLGPALGRERSYAGPMGKSDRALVFGVIAMMAGCNVPTSAWINIVWMIVVALLLLTIVNRSRAVVSDTPRVRAL